MNFSDIPDERKSYQILSSTTHFRGTLLSLRVDEAVVEGHKRRIECVTHSDAVAILARPDPDRLVMVQQWRYGAGRRLWEVPAGCLNHGEQNDVAALRELREETGYHAQRLTYLWKAYSAPGYCNEMIHFFAADHLTPGERQPDEGEEEMTMRSFHVSELQFMLSEGEIQDMKTLLAISWFTQQVKNGQYR